MSRRVTPPAGTTRRGFLGVSAVAVAGGAAVYALRRGTGAAARAPLHAAGDYRLHPVPARYRVREHVLDFDRDLAPDPDLAG